MIDSKVLRNIENQYGEAFYMIDSRQFSANYNELCDAFRSIYNNFNIAYSYKTNYLPEFCKRVNSFGGYAEVVSDMELKLALKINVNPRMIIWNGPIKDDKWSKWLLLNGGTINVDSVEELNSICQWAKENPNSVLKVGIRCNFNIGDEVISRFGIDVDGKEMMECLDIISVTPNICLVNIQCHFANRSIDFWPARANRMIELYRSIVQKIGYSPQRVDLGGGLYGKVEPSLKKQFSNYIPPYSEYAKEVATVFRRGFPDCNVQLVIEPGTALVGDCMKFYAKVKNIKNVRGKNYATVYGSQKNINMSGINPPIQVYQFETEHRKYADLDIVGYTCIEGDILYKGYEGELAVGDFLEFSNCGSYSIVMKPPFILPNFPIVEVDGKEIKCIKRAEMMEDIFRTYIF